MRNADDGEEDLDFEIKFAEKDAAKMEKATANNVGNEILIAIDDAPIGAPYILGPIAGGKVSLSITSEVLADRAKLLLSRIIRNEP